jgi:hypothetical protein
MEFILVQGAGKTEFEANVNTQLTNGFVFAGNIVHSVPDNWAMPMVKFSEEDGRNMENRLAKQLWGMFIARLF